MSPVHEIHYEISYPIFRMGQYWYQRMRWCFIQRVGDSIRDCFWSAVHKLQAGRWPIHWSTLCLYRRLKSLHLLSSIAALKPDLSTEWPRTSVKHQGLSTWHILLRFNVSSWELQRAKNLTCGGLTSDVIKIKYQHEVTSVLNQITTSMSLNWVLWLEYQTLVVHALCLH